MYSAVETITESGKTDKKKLDTTREKLEQDVNKRSARTDGLEKKHRFYEQTI